MSNSPESPTLFPEFFTQCLKSQGIDTIFGLVGDANLFLMDHFTRQPGNRYVSVTHEASAVLAASGYARATGRLGVATVTHGPALTNTVTALVENVRGRMPLLLIAGDTAVVDRENVQSVPQRDIIMPTGAGFEQVRAPETVGEDLAVAIRRAMLERRPVVLNLPADFQWAPVADATLPEVRWRSISAVAPDRNEMDSVSGLVASARRPLILAGRGAIEDRSHKAVVELAERLGAPLATTLQARDLFRGHPHNIGIFGTLSHDVALDVIGHADCVIALGASLNRWTTVEGGLLQGKRVIQADRDPECLQRFQVVDATVLGDVEEVVRALLADLDEIEAPSTGFADEALERRLEARPAVVHPDWSTESTIDIRTALVEIESGFETDRTLVLDGGRFLPEVWKLISVQHPTDYIHTTHFGSIGLSLGNALGACVASEKRTLLVTGDGGFMLGGLADFQAAVRHNLDITVVILNDSAYGAEHIQFRRRDMDPALSMFEWPSFAELAKVMGAEGHEVTDMESLRAALAAVAARRGPALIDVKLDPEKITRIDA
ncbi:thiamine pyrophosphate-binding protein [Nocardioides sp. YIM 152315]|uniref:thiamine pyrophosphate-binding protein n=1 Tax=Nocardioides sp. YIM 152315 TaxID=3031760 RepID=UPI0023DAEDBC|nr:thiamine pyrophosphate-binding protein [Nocardioides sp. YIM 152315]MDF1602222.1 thiamine pyrophosphate-binding protein [Nocardioides sp. YIM 152315]